MPHALNHLINRGVDDVAADVAMTGVLREVTDRHVTLWTERGRAALCISTSRGCARRRKIRRRPDKQGQAASVTL